MGITKWSGQIRIVKCNLDEFVRSPVGDTEPGRGLSPRGIDEFDSIWAGQGIIEDTLNFGMSSGSSMVHVALHGSDKLIDIVFIAQEESAANGSHHTDHEDSNHDGAPEVFTSHEVESSKGHVDEILAHNTKVDVDQFHLLSPC